MLEAVIERCFLEKLFLEISKNSQENTCASVSFLIKLTLIQKRLRNVNLSLKFWKGVIGEEERDEKLAMVKAFTFKTNATKATTESKHLSTRKINHLSKSCNPSQMVSSHQRLLNYSQLTYFLKVSSFFFSADGPKSLQFKVMAFFKSHLIIYSLIYTYRGRIS